MNSRNLTKAAKTMLGIGQSSFGDPCTMVLQNVALPSFPNEDEVMIATKAAGVNRMDIIQRKGFYPPPPGYSEILGPEASGVVHASQSSKFIEGDRVMSLCGGGAYAQFVTVHASLCMKIPKNLSFSQAAAIPEAWLTAYQLLHWIAKVQRGDSILIHGAGSGVGTAAIQLAKAAGLSPIIAVAGSDEKLEICKALGATHGINRKNVLPDFSTYLKDSIRSEGVDVILDCVGSQIVEQNYNCCGKNCRWVVYGFMGGKDFKLDMFKLAVKQVSILTSTLRSKSLEYRSKLIGDFSRDCLSLLEDGTLKVVVDEIFPLEEAYKAHQRMEANLNIGKIILEVPDTSDKIESN
uniref:Zinc binding alcohol dehydrogenase domain containing 2 n=1 Tax=Nephromyces sp. MMRI TaxID=2496275 RepID=A0A3S8V366_9APIC|nr:zinc binding alcohol dehydrogenase domain containing 2 [Nephromyces sp. MMRI]AZL94522.1 zinc binding alcohol dehydrogenase domain containing 2 [Nephromyces sp. MMRI]